MQPTWGSKHPPPRHVYARRTTGRWASANDTRKDLGSRGHRMGPGQLRDGWPSSYRWGYHIGYAHNITCTLLALPHAPTQDTLSNQEAHWRAWNIFVPWWDQRSASQRECQKEFCRSWGFLESLGCVPKQSRCPCSKRRRGPRHWHRAGSAVVYDMGMQCQEETMY